MKNKIFIALSLIIVFCVNMGNIMGAEEEYYEANLIPGKGIYVVNGDYYNSLVFIKLFGDVTEDVDDVNYKISKSKYEEILKDKIYLTIYKSSSGDSYRVTYQGKSITFTREYLTSYMDSYIKNNKILLDNFKRIIGAKYVNKLLDLEKEIDNYIKDQNLTDSSSGGPEFKRMLTLCQGMWYNIDQWKDIKTLIATEEIYYWNKPKNDNEWQEIQKQVSNVVRRTKYLGLIEQIKEIYEQYNEMKEFVDNVKPITNSNTEVGNGNNSNSSSAKPICDDGWWTCAFNFMEEGKKPGNNLSGALGGVTTAIEGIGDMIFDIGNMIFIIVISMLGVKYIWGGANSKFEIKNSLITVIVAAIVFYGWNSVTQILRIEELLTGPDGSDYHGLAYTVYNTILYIVNVLSVGGIIYIGIKYMMAGADGKAEMKVKLVPVIMGIIMVYGTLNLINFILKIAGVI